MTDDATPRPPRFAIVGFGELLWDLFRSGRHLGGAPANVAYHVAVLGDRGAIASRVGADPLGEEAAAELGARGIDAEALQIDEVRPTGTARVALAAEEVTFDIDGSAAWLYPQWTARWEALLSEADAISFGTLCCARPEGRHALERAAATVPDRALRLLDLNLRPPLSDATALACALACANAFKLSQEEVAALRAHLGGADPLEHLFARGARMVAVTRGGAGSSLYVAGAEEHHITSPASGVDDAAGAAADPVGAGDSFTAALIHHLLRGSAAEHAHAAASRYAAYVAGRPGATPPIPDAVRDAVRAPR